MSESSAPSDDEIRQLRAEFAVVADAQAARTLAAGADRDVAEVRAGLRSHTRVLNALRETRSSRVGPSPMCEPSSPRWEAGSASCVSRCGPGSPPWPRGMADIARLLRPGTDG